MIHTSFNLFDLGVLVIIGLSALLSFYRGFLREMLSLCSWIGAALITLYAFPYVSDLIEPQINNIAIASGLAALGVFMVAFIFVCIISGIVLKYAKPGQEIGFIDNMVGLTFGIARGVLLVAIAYFVMTLLIMEKDFPDWAKKSMTRPYVAEASRYLAEIAPAYIKTIPPLQMKAAPTTPAAVAPVVDDRVDTRPRPPEPTMQELEERMRHQNDTK